MHSEATFHQGRSLLTKQIFRMKSKGMIFKNQMKQINVLRYIFVNHYMHKTYIVFLEYGPSLEHS